MGQPACTSACWAATGTSVTAYYGYNYSQNQFCNMAFQRSIDSTCPNNQATLANDQTAFRKIGISAGSYVFNYLTYAAIVREIDARRPVMARIGWSGKAVNIFSAARRPAHGRSPAHRSH
ncbi:papain-like cysteine protease family protein [Sphaerisporangium fuscum]|uniref:papain-like cysteine protease family protein n=1 Tax=Sphaerisporangium fuscum TaxID=2835868 RepID=UPI0020299AB4|nr:papain-like cysteine protease family protein [Sphaerisporangium fuscum]